MRAVVVAVMLTVIGAPVAAHAGDGPAAKPSGDARKTAERYFRTGERLFSAGDFVHAAQAFEDAFAILPLPAIAFSAAQAYRLAWAKAKDKNPVHLRRAVGLYRRYLDDAPEGDRVVDAAAALGDLEPLLDRLAATGITAPVARTTGVTITSAIAEVTVAIDGAAAIPLPIVRDLGAGPHTLVAAAPGHAGRTLPFTAVDGMMLPVEIELDPLPALVTVRAEEGSAIAVDGRRAGHAPLASPLALAAGRHFVAVTRRGRAGFGREIDVGRGEAITLSARQPVTPQRQAARWVLVGAGVLAIGAGIAGTAAVLADGDAADLAARRDAIGLSLAERDRYEALRSERDDRRALAIGVGGAAVAVGLTGALLYLLDRDEPARGAPTIAPVLGGEGAGLALRGGF